MTHFSRRGSIQTRVQKLEPVCKQLDDRTYSVTLNFSGKQYTGIAVCHSNDLEYQSQYIGYNIALMRARVALAREHVNKTETEYKVKRQMMHEVGETEALKKNVEKCRRRCIDARRAYNDFQAQLGNYLLTLDNWIKRKQDISLKGHIDPLEKVLKEAMDRKG